MVNLCRGIVFLHFCHKTQSSMHQTLVQIYMSIDKISIDPEIPLICCFSVSQKIPSFGYIPRCTCSFNITWCFFLNGTRFSTELFIKNFFFFRRSSHISPFQPPNYNLQKYIYKFNARTPPNLLNPWTKSRMPTNTVFSSYLFQFHSSSVPFKSPQTRFDDNYK